MIRLATLNTPMRIDANVSAATDATRVRPKRRPSNDGEPRRVNAAGLLDAPLQGAEMMR